MPSDELVSILLSGIRAADRRYKRWEEKWKVTALERYYEGFHWLYDDGDNPYVLNLFYSTIETKMPALIFDNPKFRVAPTAKAINIDPEEAFQYAANLEDTINDWIAEIKNKFVPEHDAAIFDTWFRFGIIETGYASDWIDNPNAARPQLKPDFKRNINPTINPRFGKLPQLPTNEQIYVRYIPADQFRVSIDEHRYLDQCDWCGYKEFVRIDDLRATKNLRNLDKLQFTRTDPDEPRPSIIEEQNDWTDEQKELVASGDYTLIWKIWRTREKKRYIIADLQETLLYVGNYSVFPFEDLRFRYPRKGWYPQPPTFNWISPQNEINEVRESNRIHRRKFKRLYQILEGAVDYDDAIKLINGPDGGAIKATQREAITPIQNADLGASHNISMQVSKDDMNIITGTSAEQRGEADRVTATQANIVDQRAKIRESREKVIIANFMCRVVKKVLMTIKTKFVNPITVQSEITELTNEENLGGLMVPGNKVVREINPLIDFGDDDFDFNVEVTIETMSPIANEEELAKFLKFIAVLKEFPQFGFSAAIVREVAARTGYKNERVIREFQTLAQLTMLGQVEMGMNNMGTSLNAGEMGNNTGNGSQNIVAGSTPNDIERARQPLQLVRGQ